MPLSPVVLPVAIAGAGVAAVVYLLLRQKQQQQQGAADSRGALPAGQKAPTRPGVAAPGYTPGALPGTPGYLPPSRGGGGGGVIDIDEPPPDYSNYPQTSSDELPAEVQPHFQNLLSNGRDPDAMEIVAGQLDALQYPRQAAQLRAREAQLRASQPSPTSFIPGVQDEPAYVPPTPAVPVAPTQARVTTSQPAPAGDLVIRSGPSSSYAQTGGAEKNGTVRVVRWNVPSEDGGAWAYVSWSGGSRWPAATGYVHRAFLTALDGDPSATVGRRGFVDMVGCESEMVGRTSGYGTAVGRRGFKDIIGEGVADLGAGEELSGPAFGLRLGDADPVFLKHLLAKRRRGEARGGHASWAAAHGLNPQPLPPKIRVGHSNAHPIVVAGGGHGGGGGHHGGGGGGGGGHHGGGHHGGGGGGGRGFGPGWGWGGYGDWDRGDVYVSVTPEPDGSKPESRSAVALSALRMRAQPSELGLMIDTIPEGERVQIHDIRVERAKGVEGPGPGGWAQVSHAGKTGWVKSEWLKLEGAS